MWTDLENNITFEKNGLTLKIKINHQGQVTDFGFSEILDIVNVRIDTKIESIACIQPEISKVIGKMCMTLSSKIKTFEISKLFQHFRYPSPQKCWNRYKHHVCMMFTTRDMKGHTQMCCLTFIFKVNHQGQVTDFRFSEILDIVNVRIDTKIKSAA